MLSLDDTQHNSIECRSVECRYAECRVFVLLCCIVIKKVRFYILNMWATCDACACGTTKKKNTLAYLAAIPFTEK